MSEAASALPLVILAGAAKDDETVAASGAESARLRGPKGLTLRIGERPLIDEVIDRFRGCGAFDPLYVAGPASLYGASRGGAAVIDTDLDFAGNLRRSLEAVRPRKRVAFTTCDVIPEPADLETLITDYRAHAPLDYWFPLMRIDGQALGAARGKRQYRIVPEGEHAPVRILPGHLVIVEPDALRLRLLLRAMELAYRSRTRSVTSRFAFGSSRMAPWLLLRDLESALTLRLPRLTLEVLWNAALLTWRLRSGRAAQRAVERHLDRLFVRRRRRRRGRVPVLTALSLARDIDTEREAAERRARVSRPA
jgi:hypothetical protein